MIHKTIFTPVELFPGQFIQQQSSIPTILKKDGNTLDVVTDGNINVGDSIFGAFTNKEFMVKEVVEQRPAKGDWSAKQYKNIKPIWSRVIIS